MPPNSDNKTHKNSAMRSKHYEQYSTALYRWRRYESVWLRDKEETIAVFCATEPTVRRYDEKLTYYTALQDSLLHLQPHDQSGSAWYDTTL